MNRGLEGIRFGGQILIWISAWHNNFIGIFAGSIIILCAWLCGLWKK